MSISNNYKIAQGNNEWAKTEVEAFYQGKLQALEGKFNEVEAYLQTIKTRFDQGVKPVLRSQVTDGKASKKELKKILATFKDLAKMTETNHRFFQEDFRKHSKLARTDTKSLLKETDRLNDFFEQEFNHAQKVSDEQLEHIKQMNAMAQSMDVKGKMLMRKLRDKHDAGFGKLRESVEEEQAYVRYIKSSTKQALKQMSKIFNRRSGEIAMLKRMRRGKAIPNIKSERQRELSALQGSIKSQATKGQLDSETRWGRMNDAFATVYKGISKGTDDDVKSFNQALRRGTTALKLSDKMTERAINRAQVRVGDSQAKMTKIAKALAEDMKVFTDAVAAARGTAKE